VPLIFFGAIYGRHCPGLLARTPTASRPSPAGRSRRSGARNFPSEAVVLDFGQKEGVPLTERRGLW
jgi:hypothetical protein